MLGAEPWPSDPPRARPPGPPAFTASRSLPLSPGHRESSASKPRLTTELRLLYQGWPCPAPPAFPLPRASAPCSSAPVAARPGRAKSPPHVEAASLLLQTGSPQAGRSLSSANPFVMGRFRNPRSWIPRRGKRERNGLTRGPGRSWILIRAEHQSARSVDPASPRSSSVVGQRVRETFQAPGHRRQRPGQCQPAGFA